MSIVLKINNKHASRLCREREREGENLEQDRLSFQLHGGVSGLISAHQKIISWQKIFLGLLSS